MAQKKIAEFTGKHPGSTVKVYRNSETKEYVAKPGWVTSEADYFTDDKQDAIATAKAMIRKCDMAKDCPAPVTHIGSKGYVYCAAHALVRRDGGHERCRKMKGWEMKLIRSGKPLPRY